MTRFAPAVLAALLAPAALAHPLPRAESPAAKAVLSASPSEIRITFSEGLVAAFSGLTLSDAAGRTVALGPAVVDTRDHRTLSAPVKGRLAPGTYTVSWRAVGDDTHHTAGRYSFEVKP